MQNPQFFFPARLSTATFPNCCKKIRIKATSLYKRPLNATFERRVGEAALRQAAPEKLELAGAHARYKVGAGNARLRIVTIHILR